MPELSPDARRLARTEAGNTAYIEHGSGAPMVFIHGVGLRADVWHPQLAAFSPDFRVLAYDTLGHGASDRPAADADLSHYVAQLTALLDARGVERTVVVGHSMGALIATLFAIRQPDRVACLIAANPVYRRPAAQTAASLRRAADIEANGAPASLEATLERWFGSPPVIDASRVNQVRDWLAGADPVGYARAYRVFSESDPWLAGRLGELQVPALFITGALDPNSTPAMSRAMAAETPGATARVLSGERHMMAYSAPARFNAELSRFLDQNARLVAGGHASRVSGAQGEPA